MTNTLRIATRNIRRNGRRSVMTVLAIMMGGIAILLFGGFVSTILYGLQTDIIRKTGHLHVYQRNFFQYGAGNPGAWGIADYEAVIAAIKDDPELKAMVRVVTASQQLFGIAGHFAAGVSKTFLGQGMVAADRDRMRAWNGFSLAIAPGPPTGLSDADAEGGVIGQGLARILHLCGPLNVPKCQDPPRAPETADSGTADSGTVGDSLIAADLIAAPGADDIAGTDITAADKRPRIDLLGATAGGAPNVVTLRVNKAEGQGARELDDSFVAMPLSLAQQLLYGRGAWKVSGIIVQLDRSPDLKAAKARLGALFAAKGLDLEVREFTEINPMFNQVIAMFSAIFGFIAIIMAVIVLFTVVNTMSMTVMERINEIGTLRAIGVRRSGIRAQFLAEGWLLGVIGATAGVVGGLVIAEIVNRSGLAWTPPSNVDPLPLHLNVWGSTTLMAGCWLGLMVTATLSSLWPANKAARMVVVDALRHV